MSPTGGRHRDDRRRRGRRRRRRRIRRARRLLPAAVIAAAVALPVAAASAWYDLSAARSRLTEARSALEGVVDDPGTLRTPAGRAVANDRIDASLREIDAARGRLRHSPGLSLAAVVPWARGQRSGLLRLVDDARTAAVAGRRLLRRADELAEQTQLRDGAIPLEGLRALERETRASGATVRRLVRSSGGLFGPLGDARRRFDEVADNSARRLLEGADAVGAARSFMGEQGDRRYLLAIQNNAEMRDQGMVLSYAVISFIDGKLTFERQGRIGELTLDRPISLPVPAGTAAVFGDRVGQFWQGVNNTADFPWSGRAMTEMYAQATGDRLDGVVAVDVRGLEALLKVLGPVRVPGIDEDISAANASRVLLHDLYQQVEAGAQSDRVERLGDVAEVVVDRLTEGTYDAVEAGRHLGDAAAGGHLRLWSADPAEETAFESTGLGGAPGRADADRTLHVSVENRSGNKLDYFVRGKARVEVYVTDLGSAVVRTTVTVDNRAPVGGRPSYQLGPPPQLEADVRAGDYVAHVLLWGPAGAAQANSVSEAGLTLSPQLVTVAAAERREVVFESVMSKAVRDGRFELRLVPQPRLDAVELEVSIRAPGWRIAQPADWKGPWDRTRGFSWTLEH